LYEKDACLHPAKLVNGLIAKLHAAGVTLVSQAALTQLKASGQGYTATINDREFKIAKVLIATNGYTTDTTANLKKRIIPIRSTMIATEAISAQMMASVSPKLHTHGGADRLVFYCRPSPDGTRLLFGGRALDSIAKPSEYTAFLHKNMLHLFPQLAHVKLANTCSGLVAYSFDHVPHLGEMDGIYYAMGYCGSGVARANYLGHKIALKMLGKDGSSVFDQFEFPSQLFYNANPWFMPAIIRWHNLADKLGL
jgi:glycine/D-amino acid oxidase-like deaminating enzyme